MEQTEFLTIKAAINKVHEIIQRNEGDLGRLEFILESLQKGKRLYNTDQKYLEKKINAKLDTRIKKQKTDKVDRIKNIRNLIDWGIGDPGRLGHILITIQKEKPLYKTDEIYLEKKLQETSSKFSNLQPKEMSPPIDEETKIFHEYNETKLVNEEIKQDNDLIESLRLQLAHANEMIKHLEIDLDTAHKQIKELQNEIEQKNIEIQKLKTPPLVEKTNLKEENIIDELQNEIDIETKKLNEQKTIFEQMKEQRSKLTQLIDYRQKYEEKIEFEKQKIQEDIKLEKRRIKEKDQLVEELKKKQEKINQSEAEYKVIMEEIKREKARLESDFDKKKRDLENAKNDYNKLTDKKRDNDV